MKLLRRSAMPMVIISIKYSVLLLVYPLVNIVMEKRFYLLITLLQFSDIYILNTRYNTTKLVINLTPSIVLSASYTLIKTTINIDMICSPYSRHANLWSHVGRCMWE